MLACPKSLAAEIAAGVPVPAEMVAARDRSALLRQRQSTLFDEQGNIERRLSKQVTDADERRRPEILRELRDIRAEEVECLRVIAKHQPAYVAAVTKVLAPLRRSAMQKLIAIMGDLQEADAALNLIVAEINAAGGQVRPLPSPIYLDVIKTTALAMLAEQCNEE